MSAPSESEKEARKESPSRLTNNPNSAPGSSTVPTDGAASTLPQRPVLNRKASGLKFNQHFSFEKVIGSYRIVRKIGKGRFGVVKLGEHVADGGQVAIKIVDKSGLNVVESNSIKTEAEVMTCLNHPNVIRLLEVIETKYELALIMEYAAGGDLFEYVQKQKRKLTEKEVRGLFAQVVSGLSYCHRHFVVHRDIKAENILLDEKGSIRIGDWGFSSVYHPGSAIETACGSLDYAAPEVLTGLVSYGPSVDIWALGVLLFFLLTSRLPFNAPNDFDVYQLIKRAEYKCPKGLSRECKSLLKALLNPNPQARISIVEVEKWPWFTANLDTPQAASSSHHASSHFTAASSSSTTVSSAKSASSSNSSSEHKKPPSPRSGSLVGSTASPPTSLSLGSVSASSSNKTRSASQSNLPEKEAAPGSGVPIRRKKRSTKEKRSISDTKIEQSMHKLKAGSGQPAKTNSRSSSRRTAEKSRVLASVYVPVPSDPFNTITEEEDEEVLSDSTSEEEVGGLESPWELGTEVSPLLASSSRAVSEFDLAVAAAALSITATPPLPLIIAAAAGSITNTGILPALGLAGSADALGSPGRVPRRKSQRSFNTEKTKAELAVSRFIILKLNATQLEQLRLMPEFDILQVTSKTTTKDENIQTVVVATRVLNARKLLKKFEQTRRLFRWNSDTHFGLRSRFKSDAFGTPIGTPQPTPPVTPKRHSAAFRAATSPSTSASNIFDTLTSPPHSPSTSTANASALTSHGYTRARSSSRGPENGSEGSLVPIPGSSASHSPTQARRRKKSFTETVGTEPAQVAQTSPLSRAPPPRTQNPTSPSRPPVPRIQPPPAAKGKLAKMHSWSQSEFDTAAPGTLKKQLVAAPQGVSSLFRFFKKKRSDSKSSDESPTGLPEERESTSSSSSSSPETVLPHAPSKPSPKNSRASRHASEDVHSTSERERTANPASPRNSRKNGENRDHISSTSTESAKESSTPTQACAESWSRGANALSGAADATAAPNSSPAKIASPKKSKHKKSRSILDDSPPSSTEESPRPLSSNGTHDTSTEDIVSSPDAPAPEMGLLGTSKKSETLSPSTL